jgi:hypothetical protein
MAVEGRVQCVHIKLSPSGSFVREVHDTLTYFIKKKSIVGSHYKIGTLIPSYLWYTATGQ